VSSITHLARRFARSLSSAPPPAEDEAWAEGFLLRGEVEVWRRMGNPDRRHAIEVSRRFEAAVPDADRPTMAAALLHDCGKIGSGLGTYHRVAATIWIALVGRERAGRARGGSGRVARYARHEPIGADLLAEAGSAPVTIALVGRQPGAPPATLAALAAADDL
jgi:hypothetical protein